MGCCLLIVDCRMLSLVVDVCVLLVGLLIVACCLLVVLWCVDVCCVLLVVRCSLFVVCSSLSVIGC